MAVRETKTMFVTVMARKESKSTNWWQSRKVVIFYDNQHIVISFDGNEQIFSNVEHWIDFRLAVSGSSDQLVDALFRSDGPSLRGSHHNHGPGIGLVRLAGRPAVFFFHIISAPVTSYQSASSIFLSQQISTSN
jgi:hypothetical protein